MIDAASERWRSSSPDVNLAALRAIAALTVAVFHSLMWLRVVGDERLLMLPPWQASTVQGAVVRCLLAVFNGAMAVDLFFVLSGFLLSGAISARGMCARSVVAFYVRRVLRLWPAYVASLALVAVGLGLRGDFRVWPQAASWLVQFYRSDIASVDWPANLGLLSTALNPVAWSLSVEIAMSACLPLLVLTARHLGGIVALGQIVAAFIVAPFCRYDGAGHFLYIFLLGVYGGVFRAELDAVVRRWGIGRQPRVLVCIAALCVPGFVTLEHHPLADLSMALGALVLILVIVEERPAGACWAMPPAWRALVLHCGALSYSFYLCHFIVMYLLAWTVSAHVPQAVLSEWPLPVMLGVLAVALGPATLLALAVHRGIERPFMRLGQRMARGIDSNARGVRVSDAASAAQRAARRR